MSVSVSVCRRLTPCVHTIKNVNPDGSFTASVEALALLPDTTLFLGLRDKITADGNAPPQTTVCARVRVRMHVRVRVRVHETHCKP